MKSACVLGISGQTGSYLADLLLDKGYKVYGMIRRSSTFSTERIQHVFDHPNLELRYGDLADTLSIVDLITEAKPELLFNMGAQSHVNVSFKIPEYTFDINATGTIRCLEAIRKYSPKTKFLQASTSELFGSTPPPQSENTPFHPRSPYAAAKCAAYWATVNYREAYGLFAVNSVSFNHEGPRRHETFVTRKITRAATRIKLGLQKELVLGNLSAKRDWSHAKDVARGMIKIISAEEPDDYVIASGESHSVEDFLALVFDTLDLDWKEYVKFDPRYLRPSEVDHLQGDPSKIKKELGWVPEYSFGDLVKEMVDCDLILARKEQLLEENSTIER